MGKIIAALNLTVDGYCDHDAVDADEETHQHYADLLSNAGSIVFGRKTFQLMEYWQTVVANPTGNEATDHFAAVIDKIRKIVFSKTLEKVDWQNTTLKKDINKEYILELSRQMDKDMLVGSPSVIVALTKLGLIDEYQLCIHPVIVGSGLSFFRDIIERIDLKLLQTKSFKRGATVLYYERVRS